MIFIESWMIYGWWFDYTDDTSIVHPGILFHPMKWSVTSEGWKVHFACCIHCCWRLYTLLLGTRQQQPPRQAGKRRKMRECCVSLFVYLVEMQVYNKWQVTGYPNQRWLQLADSSYYSIYKYSSLMFSLCLVLYSCFLFKTTWLLNCWFLFLYFMTTTSGLI